MNREFVVENYTIPRMLTVKEAAQEFHLPTTAIREWIGEGSLPVVTCGRKHLINASVLSRFLEGTPINDPVPIKPIGVSSSGTIYANEKGRLRPIK